MVWLILLIFLNVANANGRGRESKLLEMYNNIDGGSKSSNRNLLLSDPMTAAIFATTVNQVASFSSSYGCATGNPGVCENVRLLFSNHYCNIHLDYIVRYIYGDSKQVPQNIIGGGNDGSGGEYYGALDSSGLVRYKIKIPWKDSNGQSSDYSYYIDVFWCVDCSVPYNQIAFPDYNDYGVAILNAYNNNYILTPAESYNCFYNKFYNRHSGVGYKKIDWWCDSSSYIRHLDVFDAGTSTRNKIYYNDGQIGIWTESEMTSYNQGVRTIIVDVFPYGNWNDDTYHKSECPK